MNIIGIYPGTFQPPHLGHFRAYEYLKKITGVNTFVTTSDVVELPQSPLNFGEKQQIWTRHGVPIDKVVKVKDPMKALEVTQKFGPDRTTAVFAMSSSDANSAIKNSNGYFIQFKTVLPTMETLNKHAYVLVIPEPILNVNNKVNPDMIRRAFGSTKISEEQKQSFFKQVFGWFDISLFNLIKKKFAEASTVKERVNESNMMVLKRTLKPFIRELLGQLSQPQGQIPSDPTTLPSMSPSDAAKAARLKKDNDRKQLKDKEKELDYLKKKDDVDKKMAKQKIVAAQNDVKTMKAS